MVPQQDRHTDYDGQQKRYRRLDQNHYRKERPTAVMDNLAQREGGSARTGKHHQFADTAREAADSIERISLTAEYDPDRQQKSARRRQDAVPRSEQISHAPVPTGANPEMH